MGHAVLCGVFSSLVDFYISILYLAVAKRNRNIPSNRIKAPEGAGPCMSLVSCVTGWFVKSLLVVIPPDPSNTGTDKSVQIAS